MRAKHGLYIFLLLMLGHLVSGQNETGVADVTGETPKLVEQLETGETPEPGESPKSPPAGETEVNGTMLTVSDENATIAEHTGIWLNATEIPEEQKTIEPPEVDTIIPPPPPPPGPPQPFPPEPPKTERPGVCAKKSDLPEGCFSCDKSVGCDKAQGDQSCAEKCPKKECWTTIILSDKKYKRGCSGPAKAVCKDYAAEKCSTKDCATCCTTSYCNSKVLKGSGNSLISNNLLTGNKLGLCILTLLLIF